MRVMQSLPNSILTGLVKRNEDLKVQFEFFSGVSSNANLRFEEQRSFYTSSNQYDFVGTDAKNHREILDNFEQKARNRRDVNEVAKEKARHNDGTLNYFMEHLSVLFIEIIFS